MQEIAAALMTGMAVGIYITRIILRDRPQNHRGDCDFCTYKWKNELPDEEDHPEER